MDFQSALSAGLDGIRDPQVLSFASDEGRILISHDENSMPAHFTEFLARGNHSPGILMVPQGTPVGLVIESVVLIWIASTASEWIN